MAVREFDVGEIKDLTGEEVGSSEWHLVTQEDINTFADVTHDHQWIHIDPERAKDSMFGGTIAHGYYTLSMLPHFLDQIWMVTGAKTTVNVGTNRVRFLSPVLVGSKIRARAMVLEVKEIRNCIQVVLKMTVESEGGEKPACLAEVVLRYYM